MINALRVLGYILCCLCGGSLGGYYAASFSPVPGQIAIVDIRSLVLKAVHNNANQEQTADEANALTKRVKDATDKLVEQGIIVIDSQAVLNAPEEAYVYIE